LDELVGLGPGQPVPAWRRARLPLRERRIRLGRDARLLLDADAVAQRHFGAHVDGALLGPALARAGHEDRAGSAAGADEAMLGVRWAVHEVPGLERPLLALDDQEALSGQDEEVLLVRLAVVAPARLARLEDGDRIAELGERHVVALDDAG